MSLSFVKVKVGPRPGWELDGENGLNGSGSDGGSDGEGGELGDVKQVYPNPLLLIPTRLTPLIVSSYINLSNTVSPIPSILSHSSYYLTSPTLPSPARQRWLYNPPFPKFSSRTRGKELPPPPAHTIHLLGRCALEIGPHIFYDTKIFEVHYTSSPSTTPAPTTTPTPAPAPASTPPAKTATDVLLEFRENPSERFVLPLDCSIIERVLRLGVPPTILLSTVIAASSGHVIAASSSGLSTTSEEDQKRHPLTIRFVYAETPVWEAMQARVMSSTMSIQTVQMILQRAVDNPVPRAYLPLRLKTNSQTLRNLAQASQDPYAPQPLVLKPLGLTPKPSTSSVQVPRKRKSLATSLPPSSLPQTALQKTYTTSSGRQTTAVVLADQSDAEGEAKGGDGKAEGGTGGARPSAKRTKVSCVDCGKGINRRIDDIGREGFKPTCRDCATEARRIRDAARIAAGASTSTSTSTPRPHPHPPTHPNPSLNVPTTPYRPKMKVEVVIPTPSPQTARTPAMSASTAYPYTPYHPARPPLPAGGWGGLGAVGVGGLGAVGMGGGPGGFSLFSPRPPPAPSHLAHYQPFNPQSQAQGPNAKGSIPKQARPTTNAGSAVGKATSARPTAPNPIPIPTTGTGVPLTNPYAFPYRPLPPAPLTTPASSTSAPRPPGPGTLPPPPGPAAHPYTGRYYGAPTADGSHTWRPAPAPAPAIGVGAGRGTGVGGGVYGMGGASPYQMGGSSAGRGTAAATPRPASGAAGTGAGPARSSPLVGSPHPPPTMTATPPPGAQGKVFVPKTIPNQNVTAPQARGGGAGKSRSGTPSVPLPNASSSSPATGEGSTPTPASKD